MTLARSYTYQPTEELMKVQRNSRITANLDKYKRSEDSSYMTVWIVLRL